MENQNTLNEINLHLEELVLKKTESIKQQNQRLIKYAHSNAHHVRGPIARLLGLVQLSRLKTDLDYPWLFEKVENESTKLDEIVKNIASELDQIDQDNITES
jgi:signal transduction histidine kinase